MENPPHRQSHQERQSKCDDDINVDDSSKTSTNTKADMDIQDVDPVRINHDPTFTASQDQDDDENYNEDSLDEDDLRFILQKGTREMLANHLDKEYFPDENYNEESLDEDINNKSLCVPNVPRSFTHVIPPNIIINDIDNNNNNNEHLGQHGGALSPMIKRVWMNYTDRFCWNPEPYILNKKVHEKILKDCM